MIDFQALMLDPLYATLGVPAVITLPMESDDDELTNTFPGLTVIDKTSGVTVGEQNTQVETIEPGCCIRRAELDRVGLTLAELDGAFVSFNGSRWTIKSVSKRPVPNGPRKGEVLFLLGSETELDSSS